MLIFWTLAGLATAMAALLVLGAARKGADALPDPSPDTIGPELAELDRLRQRGLLTDETWTTARAEAGRRLLAGQTAPWVVRNGRHDGRWVLMAVGLTAAAALGLYVVVGTPGFSDQGFEMRVDEWATSPETLEPAQIAAVVGRVVREQPNDHQALTMLGAARFEAGDPLGAASAFRRALAVQPEDAQSWARLGESLVRSQDGVVGTDAEAAFRRSLSIDPQQLGARFFLGEAAMARKDAAAARTYWQPLIAALDPADPRRVELQARLSVPAADAAAR